MPTPTRQPTAPTPRLPWWWRGSGRVLPACPARLSLPDHGGRRWRHAALWLAGGLLLQGCAVAPMVPAEPGRVLRQTLQAQRIQPDPAGPSLATRAAPAALVSNPAPGTFIDRPVPPPWPLASEFKSPSDGAGSPPLLPLPGSAR